MRIALLCAVASLALAISTRAQTIEGSWQGSVKDSGVERHLVLHITTEGGALKGSFDLPDDFDFGNPLSSISFENSSLKFAAGPFSFEGKMSADGNTIDGAFTHDGQQLPCVFTRKAAGAVDVADVLRSLQSFTHLPADEWRFHVGDVPHGETPSLDDSSWMLVRGGTQSSTEAVWYRRWIEVPKNLNGYDLTGTRIWFQFRAYANGPMPQIIYFNGRRVAMGDDLEPIVLFDDARPGDKILVAVKLLHTVDQKTFAGAELKIDFAEARPNPSDLMQEIESTATLTRARWASEPSVKQQFDAAVLDVDLSALREANQQEFDSSLRKAQSALESMKPLLQGTEVRLTGNAHIDAAWLWPWTETVDVVRRTFGTALQLMDEYPDYTYTQSAAAYSEWIVDKYPDEYKQILDRVKQGRWELVGGMWVEPDLNIPCGESLVRQLLVGQRYFKDKFGVTTRIGWNPDSFGYNWQLPQIYKRSGIDYFVTQKMAWNDTTQLPLKLFWWQSPDGSRVLTYFPHDYVNEIDPVKISSDVAKARELNPGLTEMMHLYGIGDHGGGPTRAMLDSGMHWTQPQMVAPPMKWGVAQGFFSDVETKVDTADAPVWNYKTLAAGDTKLPEPPPGKISLPVWDDELYFEYHRGVFTTQAEHKRNIREGEEQLLNAEKISSLAWVDGASYPDGPLTEAWKKVLFNQFHDLAAGSGIGVIYKDAQRDFDVVRWTTRDASIRGFHRIASEIDTKAAPGVPVMVWNPLAWERTDVVEASVQLPEPAKNGIAVIDAKGNALPVQILSSNAATNTYDLLIEAKNVPSMGYEILHVVPEKREVASDLKASGLTLENKFLRVTVDPHSGCVTSLFDKRTNFESIAKGGCGNELVAFKDTPKDYDAWNIDADFDKVFWNLDKADSVELVDRGPLRASIRVTRTWQKSKFVQDIRLYAGLDRVDVANDFDWHETHVLLKAAFPLAASSNEATFEIPYGSIERPTTRNNKVEQAKFEVPALRWADLGDANHGFSLINESKYGYDAKGNVLRISLLRSPTWPDPDADRGEHRFLYSLYPHAGDWKQAMTVRHGYDFNYELQSMQLEAHEGKRPAEHSFVSVDNPNVVLTAVKKAEDADGLIFRFYEWAGKSGDVRISVPKGAASATMTNLMEKPEGAALAVTNDQVTVPVHPYEIVSVRVDYPHEK
ncbi:MAG TPA: glycoside hydrolase family 38 C-terminal domain-containing protein [Candidatus Limnocylindrales bacterium]|nr:glycoside hydrolase family 38 C-terminal domain-containing protein [Candidatus Limnocylindrales bacterium]